MTDTITAALRAISCTADTARRAATRITIARTTSRRYNSSELSMMKALERALIAEDMEKAERVAAALLRVLDGDLSAAVA